MVHSEGFSQYSPIAQGRKVELWGASQFPTGILHMRGQENSALYRCYRENKFTVSIQSLRCFR